MKGLELCEKFFYEYGLPVFEEKFPEIMPYLCFGLVGSGSECFGYDDGISTDHDFEPGFCVFLPDESVIDRRTEFLLERAYAKLPKEFMGFKRNPVNPVGGNRHGIIRTSDFFYNKCGDSSGNLSVPQWLSVPEFSFAEATNGKVFTDNYGEFSAIRKRIHFYPDDIRLKKIAGNLLIMGQSGQYNYSRCIKRGEKGAAQLSVFDFVKSAMNVIFLLNGKYMPYYKWSFRAMRDLNVLNELENDLVYLISSDNNVNSNKKEIIIEGISEKISEEIFKQNLCCSENSVLEELAYSVNNIITDNEIRNLHILAAI